MSDFPKIFFGYERDDTPLGSSANRLTEVYHAVNHSRREVAIKIFNPALATEEAFRASFMREVRADRLLRAGAHSHIVPILAEGIHDQQGVQYPYIISEYMSGGNLREFINNGMESRPFGKGPMDIGLAISIGLEVLAGLRESHPLGVIHADIKPENILFDEKGKVYLGDFGVALIDTGSSPVKAGTVSFQSGDAALLLGDPNYRPTEIRTLGKDGKRRRHDARGDIYQTGLVLYDLLGKTGNYASSPLREVNTNVDAELENIIIAFTRDYDRRVADATTAWRMLARYGARDEIATQEASLKRTLGAHPESPLVPSELMALRTSIDTFATLSERIEDEGLRVEAYASTLSRHDADERIMQGFVRRWHGKTFNDEAEKKGVVSTSQGYRSSIRGWQNVLDRMER